MLKSYLLTTAVRAVSGHLGVCSRRQNLRCSLTRFSRSPRFPPPQTLATSIAATRAQNGTPARGWKLESFTGVNTCAPVPVVIKPATDSTTYTINIYGDATVANSLNAYVKDGQVYVENTAPFNTAKPVGIVLTMPSDSLEAVNNKGIGGSASLTAVSGFKPSTVTVNTIAGSGPTVLGINNATSAIYISHASSTDLRISGEVGTIDFSTTGTSSGNAVFNAVSNTANLDVASKLQNVYVGGAQDVLVTGSSLGATTYSNGTCSLSSGLCTQVAPQAVEGVEMPTFKGASVAQICSCSGGCVNPPPPPQPKPSPPPPPPPQPRPSPPPGSSCISTGPNCQQCCQNKRNSNRLAWLNDSSCQFGGACWSRPTPSPPTPPPPTPTPLGSSCASTGPDCQQCCQQKYYTDRAAYNNDKSCQKGGVCEWAPYSTGFIG